MPRQVITVDGLSASGKSTLSIELAKLLGFSFFSSGLVYRACALVAEQLGLDNLDDAVELVERLKGGNFHFEVNPNSDQAFAVFEGKVVGGDPFSVANSERTSILSQNPDLRSFLLDLQRHVLEPHDLVIEGRDMGTTVFPDATLKFFVEVDPQIRASRRAKQVAATRPNLNAEDIAREIHERDQRDSSRKHSPAQAATDAIIIDNSSEDLTKTLQQMYSAALANGVVGKSSQL